MDTATTLGTALSLGRITYSLASVVAPTTAAKGWIGRAAGQPSVHPMTRVFGIRDVALRAAAIGALRTAGPEGACGGANPTGQAPTRRGPDDVTIESCLWGP